MVRRRDALQVRADLGPAAGRVASATRGLGFGKVEEGLEGVREDGAVVEGGFGEGARFLEPRGSILGQVPEVAPCSSGVKDNFGVVGEVELVRG
jgi:hypothetical protein